MLPLLKKIRLLHTFLSNNTIIPTCFSFSAEKESQNLPLVLKEKKSKQYPRSTETVSHSDLSGKACSLPRRANGIIANIFNLTIFMWAAQTLTQIL